MKESTCFGLLRHAQTVWNQQKKIQGRLDSELTEAGIEQIHRWSRFLDSAPWNWSMIAASPAPRAQKTAALINRRLNLRSETIQDLREQDWGTWEGLSRAEIELSHKHILEEQVENGWSFRPPAGESRREVLDRARSALADLGDRHPGEDILVICHQGVIKALVYAIEKRKFKPDETRLLDKNKLQLLSWNGHAFSAKAYNISPADQA